MRVFIAGIDGYLGWPLAQHLAAKGHEVAGADNLLRRRWVDEMGSCSAIPVGSVEDRLAAFAEKFGKPLTVLRGDLRNYEFVEDAFAQFRPEAVVHFGECPSAPYSMIDREHAVFVQTNNVTTTFNIVFAMNAMAPDAHLVKLGTMGEYGTPNVDIPEGFFEVEFRGRTAKMPFPRQAGSWYHWSKVHGSNNIMFACKIYGLRSTDVMQGVVFGTRVGSDRSEGALATRLDFDQAFGTAVNRFCCQAVIGHPLTLYGSGGQKRGFLPLRDSMQCLTLALENPPARGEYRVLNQFEEVYDIQQLATKVEKVARDLGMDVGVAHLENPRKEQEEHHYRPDHEGLFELGYKPTRQIEDEIRSMIEDLSPHRERIAAKRAVLVPDVRWDGRRERVVPLKGSNARVVR
jgi:UDP-sulfoquinovose synthase